MNAVSKIYVEQVWSTELLSMVQSCFFICPGQSCMHVTHPRHVKVDLTASVPKATQTEDAMFAMGDTIMPLKSAGNAQGGRNNFVFALTMFC